MGTTAITDVPGIVDPEELGAGSFGTVYRAHQPAFDRTVAVKVLHDTVDDDRTRTRFEREARAMGKLSGHPHIVIVHDSGVTERGNPYLVMALEGGGSLDDRLKAHGPMAWREVADVGVKLAGALQTAHDAGILHRDIKPANVLVSDFGQVKLGDFGIARLSGAGASTTGSGVTASIAHAPPEVLDGAGPTAVSDVYALASTLYTLLLGAPPFVRDTDESIVPILARIMTEPPPPLPADVPAALAEVITSGLAKDPAQRPATAAAFGQALRSAQQAAGIAPTTLPIRQTLAVAAAEELEDRREGRSTEGSEPALLVDSAVEAGQGSPPESTVGDGLDPGAGRRWWWVAALIGIAAITGFVLTAALRSADGPTPGDPVIGDDPIDHAARDLLEAIGAAQTLRSIDPQVQRQLDDQADRLVIAVNGDDFEATREATTAMTDLLRDGIERRAVDAVAAESVLQALESVDDQLLALGVGSSPPGQ